MAAIFTFSPSSIDRLTNRGRPSKGEGAVKWRCVDTYEWAITIKGLSERRGPAAVAVQLYEEGEESRAQRIAQIAARKAHGSVWGERKGRPTKRERRQIIRFREGE
jgi:hypothetical protein